MDDRESHRTRALQTTIYFTEEQTAKILLILGAMTEGDACIAQVYWDGVLVRVLDHATAKRVQAAIGEVGADDPGYSSAAARDSARLHQGH